MTTTLMIIIISIFIVNEPINHKKHKITNEKITENNKITILELEKRIKQQQDIIIKSKK